MFFAVKAPEKGLSAYSYILLYTKTADLTRGYRKVFCGLGEFFSKTGGKGCKKGAPQDGNPSFVMILPIALLVVMYRKYYGEVIDFSRIGLVVEIQLIDNIVRGQGDRAPTRCLFDAQKDSLGDKFVGVG